MKKSTLKISLGILVLLGVLLGPILFRSLIIADSNMKEMTARTQLDILCVAIEGYRHDVGVLPTSLDLLIKDDGNGKWHGPYLKKHLPKDPWYRPYRYYYSASGYLVKTDGEDSLPGTPDDIIKEVPNKAL